MISRILSLAASTFGLPSALTVAMICRFRLLGTTISSSIVEDTLVYYSLGNFVNWTSGTVDGVANRMVGGMARVTLTREEDGGRPDILRHPLLLQQLHRIGHILRQGNSVGSGSLRR